ncbi:MAG TPA: glutaminyl-peptide cyclotransferase [Flavobacterium sp.]|jgi:glutamine cyclotransferase
MKIYNLLTFILLSAATIQCGDPKKNGEKFFSFDESKFEPTYVNTDVISLQLSNPQNKNIDSIIYYVNDKKVTSVKGLAKAEFPLTDQKLGYQNLKALVYFDGDTSGQEITGRVELVSSITPKPLKYTVVATYPHDITAFTEGLEFYRDTLFEGTGQKGSSWLRKLDYRTGKVYKQVNLEQQYFGEGITVLNDKVFQLTWQSGVGLIYNANTLKLEKTFNYDKQIEGWGMTNDGKYIYHSDGTEKIWQMDPATQKMVDYVNVYSSKTKIKSVNELEWIDGKIYGNIWQKDALAIINPDTGAVEAVLNLADLRKKLTNPNSEVLNGIAYNRRTNTIFVTGKHWDKMFEIKVSE